MKTIYLKKKRSGNYEISNRKDHTIKFNKVSELNNWFNNILSKEKTNTFNRRTREFKKAQIVKATYSKTQTYYNSAKELYVSFNLNN